MRNVLAYLFKQGRATQKNLFPDLAEGVRGLPKITDVGCVGEAECNACVSVCPTDAIAIEHEGSAPNLVLDRGACIACGLCMQFCPTGTIVNDRSTKTAVTSREALVQRHSKAPIVVPQIVPKPSIFKKSIGIRVVSTGCSACDAEIGACGNPVFDMERFGAHVVASPRFADVLAITGPVPKAMHAPLLSAYQQMPEPKLVIAVGSCAISGGVHGGGYTEANGASAVLPVDVFVPGCPPHPWSIIYGIHKAMGY
jgi:Ni,Fe-hydrogenase III small subunit/formate hydrogenlyase subunit 6/NADH:ubiquinone oxidoreductase subunit I